VRDEDSTPEEAAEIIRKRYRYQQLILTGKLWLPHERAAELLGPDCLYHLYSLRESEAVHHRKVKSKPGKQKTAKRR